MRCIKTLAVGLTAGLLSLGTAWGDSGPTYKDGVLTIPGISTDGQVGQYQDAVLEMDAQGLWRLQDVLALGGNPGLSLLPVQSVEVVKTDTVPVQVILRIGGYLPSGCSGVGKVTSRRVGNRFETAIFNAAIASSEYVCTAQVGTYVKSVALDVYGLAAGSYTFDVNGVLGGFELIADNVLSGDGSSFSIVPPCCKK